VQLDGSKAFTNRAIRLGIQTLGPLPTKHFRKKKTFLIILQEIFFPTIIFDLPWKNSKKEAIMLCKFCKVYISSRAKLIKLASLYEAKQLFLAPYCIVRQCSRMRFLITVVQDLLFQHTNCSYLSLFYNCFRSVHLLIIKKGFAPFECRFILPLFSFASSSSDIFSRK